MTDEEIAATIAAWEATREDPVAAGRVEAEAAARRFLGALAHLPGMVGAVAPLFLAAFVEGCEERIALVRKRGPEILRHAPREFADVALAIAGNPRLSDEEALAQVRAMAAAAPGAGDDRRGGLPPTPSLQQAVADHAQEVASGIWPLAVRLAVIEQAIERTTKRLGYRDETLAERVRRCLLHEAAEAHFHAARDLALDETVPLVSALAVLDALAAKPGGGRPN